MTMLKELKLEYINYQKEFLIVIMSSSMEKKFMITQLISIKRYEEIRKLTTGQGED